MNRILIFLFFYVWVMTCIAQAPEIEWQKVYGGNLYDILLSADISDENNLISVGLSYSDDTGNKTTENIGADDYWIIKTNDEGEDIWQKSIGGFDMDRPYSVKQTLDSGFILGGYSASGIGGDKTEYAYGNNDYWVVKINGTGEIVWQNNIGGLYDDLLYTIELTEDGGYILGGASASDSAFDKSEDGHGGYDFWILKLDSLGNIQWQNTIGGDGNDGQNFVEIISTPDGGFLLGGSSDSDISGDKTEDNYGDLDFWILKLDSFGNILWQTTIGGNNADFLSAIITTSDGGILVSGSSNSDISGNKTENSIGVSDFQDYWVLKLNDVGEIIWQNTIGGDATEILNNILETEDGLFILAGSSYSGVSGDKVEPNIWNSDYWVLKIDNAGSILWQTTIGGDSYDLLQCVSQMLDGSLVLFGHSSSSISGDKTEACYGGADFWIVKLLPEDCVETTFYFDNDGDSFGDFDFEITACYPPVDYVPNNLDCNDDNSLINPLILEICNIIDDDCDGIIDDSLDFINYFVDIDSDGFGDFATSPVLSCSTIIGYVLNNDDCNDSNFLISPEAIENCNNLDDNCNDLVDDGLAFNTYYQDLDGDEFGNQFIDSSSCTLLEYFVIDSTDCDDTNPSVFPGATEITNSIDDNCNDLVDEVTSLSQELHTANINISPNPTNGFISIDFTNFLNKPVILNVYNLEGEIVYKEILLSGQLHYLNLEMLNTGLYIFQIKIDNSYFKKVIEFY